MNDIKPTLTEVVDKLKTAGSADQIALFLEEQGVVGRPRRAQSCAIAEYVKATTGLQAVSVDDRGICGAKNLPMPTLNFWREECDLRDSPAIGQFILNFDAELYPNLIEAGY